MLDFLIIVCLGGFLSSFSSYLWHRFIEHKQIAGNLLAFRHLKHHKIYTKIRFEVENNAKYENVNAWSFPCFFFGTAILVLIADFGFYSLSFVIGFVGYQFLVSYFHRAYHESHHWLNDYLWFKRLADLHRVHHSGRYNYGFLFCGFDRVFRTYRSFELEKKHTTVKGS